MNRFTQFSLIVVGLFVLLISQTGFAQIGRFVYSSQSDPEQVNGGVGGAGNIQTTGNAVVFSGPWSVISTQASGEATAAARMYPESFEAAWKYVDASQIRNGLGSGLSIKYYDDIASANRIDEYRMIVFRDTLRGPSQLYVFWANWDNGADVYGGINWTESGNGWGGASRTSEWVPVPNDAICFKVAYDLDTQIYTAFYGYEGKGWTKIDGMDLPADSLAKASLTLDNASAGREFQFPSMTGVPVALDWLVIKGNTLTEFNPDIEGGTEDLAGNMVGRLVYSSASDPQQINGDVNAGNISTSENMVVFKGAWTGISTAPNSVTPNSVAFMSGTKPFQAAWKYNSIADIPDSGGSGLTIKYLTAASVTSSTKDEYRMVVVNTGGILTAFWCTYNNTYGAAWSGTSTWGGCGITSEPDTIPNQALYYKVAYDGYYNYVYYSEAGNNWIELPGMRLSVDSLQQKAITVQDTSSFRQFQFVSRNGAIVNLDWIVIKGKTCPDFNEAVEKGVEDLLLPGAVTGIENETSNVPTAFLLKQNYPNPFNPSTNINFSLPITSFVKLQVFNALGQLVTTLAEKEFSAGNHLMTWTANNNASGIYFLKIQANNFVDVKKMILLK